MGARRQVPEWERNSHRESVRPSSSSEMLLMPCQPRDQSTEQSPLACGGDCPADTSSCKERVWVGAKGSKRVIGLRLGPGVALRFTSCREAPRGQ